MMRAPVIQLRLACTFCSAPTVLEPLLLTDGCYRCAACHATCDMDLSELRRCAAGLYGVIAKLSERSQA